MAIAAGLGIWILATLALHQVIRPVFPDTTTRGAVMVLAGLLLGPLLAIGLGRRLGGTGAGGLWSRYVAQPPAMLAAGLGAVGLLTAGGVVQPLLTPADDPALAGLGAGLTGAGVPLGIYFALAAGTHPWRGGRLVPAAVATVGCAAAVAASLLQATGSLFSGLVHRLAGTAGLIGMVAMLGGMIWLGAVSGALRRPSSRPPTPPAKPKRPAPKPPLRPR